MSFEERLGEMIYNGILWGLLGLAFAGTLMGLFLFLFV